MEDQTWTIKYERRYFRLIDDTGRELAKDKDQSELLKTAKRFAGDRKHAVVLDRQSLGKKRGR